MKLYVGGIADPGPHQLASSLPLLLATPQIPPLSFCGTEPTCIGVEVIKLLAFLVWLETKCFLGGGAGAGVLSVLKLGQQSGWLVPLEETTVPAQKVQAIEERTHSLLPSISLLLLCSPGMAPYRSCSQS